MSTEPTCAEIYAGSYEGDTFEEVSSHADPSWRHGCYMTDVYRRKSDGTFWQVSYRRSGDGETCGLREGDGDVVQVTPVTKTVTEYVRVTK